jgi:hypothetical protein
MCHEYQDRGKEESAEDKERVVSQSDPTFCADQFIHGFDGGVAVPDLAVLTLCVLHDYPQINKCHGKKHCNKEGRDCVRNDLARGIQLIILEKVDDRENDKLQRVLK